jgi:hypothetical protein
MDMTKRDCLVSHEGKVSYLWLPVNQVEPFFHSALPIKIVACELIYLKQINWCNFAIHALTSTVD